MSDEERSEHVRKESMELYSEILIEFLKSNDFILQSSSGIDVGDVYDVGTELMTSKFGRVRIVSWCQSCKSPANLSFYKGLGPADITHVLLAQNMKCDEFLTFDGDYRSLQDEPSLKPLDIKVIK